MNKRKIVHAVDIKKTYPGDVPTHALNGVSFEVAEGEFVAVMGRSGSGKSTLLHQLSLIDTPTAGRIVLDDIDVLRLSKRQKARFRLERLGYVFQEFALIVEMTVLQNVTLPAIALGSGGDIRAQAIDRLHRVGLKDRIDHYPSALSGGEQQRVAIARALMNQPKILFADEPTANLDSVSAATVLELFLELKTKFDQTIIMVTHEQEDQKYVDRVIWLKDGHIEKIELGGQGQ